MQCLWWFIVLLSDPYKLIMLCNAAIVSIRHTHDSKRKKMRGVWNTTNGS